MTDRSCANYSGSGYCSRYHRKHPTPEQYKEEYGVDYPDDGAVYSRRTINDDKTVWGDWRVMFFGELKTTMKIVPEDVVFQIVCACTPFGKPGRDWKT